MIHERMDDLLEKARKKGIDCERQFLSLFYLVMKGSVKHGIEINKEHIHENAEWAYEQAIKIAK